MSYESSTSLKARQRIASIKRTSNFYKGIPVLAGLAPFIPAAAPVFGGLLAGIAHSYFARQAKEAVIEGVSDARYAQKEMADCTITDSTFVGMAMPMEEFKDSQQIYIERFGRMTPNLRRAHIADELPRFQPFMMPDSFFTRHMALLGQTGVGKTETMLSMLYGVTSRGGGGLIFEAKGGRDVPLRVYEMLKRQGREQDFRFLNFDGSGKSHSYNPFKSGSARTMISTGMMVLPSDGDEFFKDVNRYALTAAIVCLKNQPGNPRFAIKDMVVLFSDIYKLVELYQKMPETSDDYRKAKQFVYQFLTFWKSRDREGNEYLTADLYQNRLMGLVAKLSSFTHSEFGDLINSYDPEIDLREAIEQGLVVVISFSSLSDPDGTELFGKLAMADFARAVGDVHAAGTKPMVPFLAFLDEYPSFKAEFHEKLWQLARSANVSMCLSAQGYNFLANESESFAKNILANCWHHIYYDVRDKETRELAQGLSQTVINMFAQDSESETLGHSQSSETSGLIGQMSSGTSTSKGFKATREELLQPDDWILEEGDAIMVGKTATLRMRLPMINWNTPLMDWDDMELEHWDETTGGLDLWDKSFDRGHDFQHFLH